MTRFEDETIMTTFGPLSPVAEFDAALQRVTQQRGSIYGHPAVDFDRAARLKAVVAECKDPILRNVLDSICVKMARLIHTPTHMDGWIDIAGYSRTAAMCIEASQYETKAAE
jgi:hypothetical protein